MQYNDMNRDELRRACKEAGIKYGNMKRGELITALQANDGIAAMGAEFDEALSEYEDWQPPADLDTSELAEKLNQIGSELISNPMLKALQQGTEIVKIMQEQSPEVLHADQFIEGPAFVPVEHPDYYYVELAARMDKSALGADGVEGHCPHCGVHLSNGFSLHEKGETQAHNHFCFLCLGCRGEWGPSVAEQKPKLAGGTGMKIEMVRPRRNGIARPSAGGKCRAVWDECDRLTAEGITPVPKLLKDWAVDNGQNENNAVIEMYNWRKFNGITGRQK